jgi:hypothetical protein
MHVPPSEAPFFLQRRFQVVNIWRPISHPAFDWPLALCDYRTVGHHDTFPVTLTYAEGQTEIFVIKYNKNQKWGYYYGMTPDEALLIKS